MVVVLGVYLVFGLLPINYPFTLNRYYLAIYESFTCEVIVLCKM